MSQEGLVARMAHMREEDLVRVAYANEQEGFEPEAVEVARQELQRRQVSRTSIEALTAEIAEIDGIDEGQKIERLGVLGRVFFLVLAPVVFTWLGAVALKWQGYDQKSRDAWRWIIYGFGFWIFVPAVLFVIFDLLGV